MKVACIPALDEEKTIAKVVLGAQKHVDKVFVCDDGSTDLTAVIAEKLGATVIRHDHNIGKGEALRSLFLAAKDAGASVMVTLDGDGQHSPEDIPKLLSVMDEGSADIAIGSRFLSGNEVPSHRALGNKILNVMTNLEVTDTQSGFRAYNKRAIEKIVPSEMGMGVDSEILIKAAGEGLSIAEVPVSVAYGIGKTSKHNPIYHTLDVIFTILKLTSIRHPLIFYGLPGIAIILAGLFAGLRAESAFVLYGITQFTLAVAFLAFFLLILGTLTLFTGIILFTVSTLMRGRA